MSRQSETARAIHLDGLRSERVGIEQRIELAGDDAAAKARLQARLTSIDAEIERVGGTGAEQSVRGRRREVRA